MSVLLTSFDPTSAASGNFIAAFKTGCGTLHIKNASPVDVGFSLDATNYVQYVVQAGEPRDIPVPRNRSTVYWSQQQKLNTNTKKIQSVVYVEQYESTESIPASQALARHVNPTNVGFIAWTQLFATAAIDWVTLIAFNPAGSGVNAIFYSLAADTTAAGITTLMSFLTTDPAFTAAGNGINQLINGPASVSVLEFSTTRTGTPGSSIRQVTLAANVPYDFIPFPDQVEAPPGTGIAISAFPNSTTVGVDLMAKWTETAV